jgi:hypothetical protein
LDIELFTAKTKVSSVLEGSFILSEASRPELSVSFCSSKWLAQGLLDFLSPLLEIPTVGDPLDMFRYLVEVLHAYGHPWNLRISFRKILQGQIIWKDGSLMTRE